MSDPARGSAPATAATTTTSATAAARKRKRRFAVQRKRALTQSKTLARQLQQALSASTPARPNLAADAHALVATLRSLRAEVLRSGTGSQTAIVASGLKDLETAVSKLAAGNAASDPAHAMALAAAGSQALQSAHAKAKAAGHAWPL